MRGLFKIILILLLFVGGLGCSKKKDLGPQPVEQLNANYTLTVSGDDVYAIAEFVNDENYLIQLTSGHKVYCNDKKLSFVEYPGNYQLKLDNKEEALHGIFKIETPDGRSSVNEIENIRIDIPDDFNSEWDRSDTIRVAWEGEPLVDGQIVSVILYNNGDERDDTGAVMSDAKVVGSTQVVIPIVALSKLSSGSYQISLRSSYHQNLTNGVAMTNQGFGIWNSDKRAVTIK